MSVAQRLAIDALLGSATRPQALKKLLAAGVNIEANTFYRWLKQPAFLRAWKAREVEVAARITKDSVILNAQSLLEEAMTEQPIVAKRSGEIIGYKVELGHALTANEQMGKAVGAFGQSVDGKTVVVIDIDFSGRKNPVQEISVQDGKIVDADYTEIEAGQHLNTPRPEKEPKTPEGFTAEGALLEEPDWLR